MLRTPEGRAWGILLIAFVLFCALAVSVPLSIRWYIVSAADAQETTLERPIDGVVHIREPRGTAFIRITERSEHIAEGTTIATDEDKRAFVRFFDGSTLTLYSDTEVVLERVRAPRFAASPGPNAIHVSVLRGRVAIGVAAPLERALDLQVHTPQASLLLAEGNFSIVVDGPETQLTIRDIRPGEATVLASGETRRFSSGRYRIVEGLPIEGPLPPEQDLVLNGDFSAMLDRGWEDLEQQRQRETDPFGTATIVPLEARTVLAFQRDGAVTHGETSLVQYIDKDVRDFESLQLTCEVLVNDQSLAGGGYESSEFPVMIELRYRDQTDTSRSLYWGFYYKDPGTGPEWWPIMNGIKVIQGEWYPFESENLMQSPGTRDSRPAHIEAIRVYASGWEWDSAITNISLLVRE